MEKKEFVSKEENKVQKSVWKMLKKNKDEINASESMLVIASIIIGFLICLAEFLKYLFNMQHFNYWNIDMVFYENMNFTHQFIYMIAIVCVLALFVIFVSTNKKQLILQGIFFVGTNVLIGLPNVLNYGIELNWLFGHVVAPCVLFIFFVKFKYFVQLRSYLRKYEIIKNLTKSILTLTLSIFLGIIMCGLFASFSNTEYKIIKISNEIAQVILYSTQNYYIIAECNEKDNVLYVNNNVQKKISAENVEYEIMTFDKIEK